MPPSTLAKNEGRLVHSRLSKTWEFSSKVRSLCSN
jgi:hypothetical protein